MTSKRNALLFVAGCFVFSAVFFALFPFRSMGAGANATIAGIVTVSVASAFQFFLGVLLLCVWLFFRRDRSMFCLVCVCLSGAALEVFNLLCEIGPSLSNPSVALFYSAGYGTSANLMVLFVALYFHLYLDRAARERTGAPAADRAGRWVLALLWIGFVILPIGQILFYSGVAWSGAIDLFKRVFCGLIVVLTILRLCRMYLIFPNSADRPAVASSILYGAGGVRDLLLFSGGTAELRLHGVATGSALMGLILFAKIAMEYAEAQRKLRSWSVELEGAVAERTRELAESNEKLQMLERRRREMIANIAHDLRAPVAAISGAIRLLENSPAAEVAAERSRQLTNRIRDLFELTRLETGGVTLSPVSISAGALLQDFFDHYEMEFSQISPEDNPPELSLSLPGGSEDMEVEVDFERLWQIFDNLVANARRHMEDNPKLIFILRRSGNEAIFTLEDNGKGIDLPDPQCVFERFYTTSGSGGLGLPIAKALVELHGGRMWIESEPGRGCRVSFALPLRSRRAGF